VISDTQLTGLALIDGLRVTAIRWLSERGTERRYRAGQPLFHAGDSALGLFVILSGRVRVVRSTRRRAQVVHEEGPGGTLGEIPLFTRVPYPATATAVEPTCCVAWSRQVIRAAMALDPLFGERLLANLARRVGGLIDRLDRMVSLGVRARVAGHVLSRARASSTAVFSLGMTQSQLAEELGTVREVVVRELAALRRAGAVRSHRTGRLEVLDRAGLERLANGA